MSCLQQDHRTSTILTILHLYTGAVTQDLTVDQYSTQKDQCSTAHIGDPTATIKTPSKMQPQTAYIIIAQ